MKKWISLFLLSFLSEPVFADCTELAALARSVENSVAEAGSDKIKVEFSWGRLAYDNAISFGEETQRVRWLTRDECYQVSSVNAANFMDHESSWFIRINRSMDYTFRRLLPLDDFNICHSRFEWARNPWGGVTYDFVMVESAQCKNVSFSFGTKETWAE